MIINVYLLVFIFIVYNKFLNFNPREKPPAFKLHTIHTFLRAAYTYVPNTKTTAGLMESEIK